MLILASTSDRLQLTTSAAGSIDVHASWMDNISGAVAPGRTNTSISTAATTTIVAAPASNTQRNVKTLQIRNKAATSNTVTIIHTDGATSVELHKVALAPGGTVQYVDEHGFKPASLRMVMQTLKTTTPNTTRTGTYTPTPGMSFCIIETVGGGGSGGDAAWTIGRGSGGGGGSGGYSRKLCTAADIGASQPFQVGKGGYAASSPNGENGAPTYLGGTSVATSICGANGGFGGGYCLNGAQTPIGGAGADPGVGDVTSGGDAGEQGGYVYFPAGSLAPDDPIVMPDGGKGANGPWGGGAPLPAVGITGSLAARPAKGYGAGSSGAISNQTGGYLGVAPAGDGVIVITEFCL